MYQGERASLRNWTKLLKFLIVFWLTIIQFATFISFKYGVICNICVFPIWCHLQHSCVFNMLMTTWDLTPPAVLTISTHKGCTTTSMKLNTEVMKALVMTLFYCIMLKFNLVPFVPMCIQGQQ